MRGDRGTGGARWTGVVAAGVGLVVTSAVVMGDAGAVDAAPPVLAISATNVAPGESVTLTVTGCAAQPQVLLSEPFGGRFGMPTLVQDPPGTWTTTIGTAPAPGKTVVDDLTVRAVCDFDGEAAEALIDVEDPILRLGPYRPAGLEGIPVAPEPGTATTAFGTDCPAGSTVRVEVEVDDGPMTVHPAVAADAEGDWQVSLPEAQHGATITVRAACGDLVYAPVSFVRAGPGTPSTSTTSTPAEPTAPVPSAPVPSPTPARPQVGRPSYTG